jgi:hypothetical protein
MKLACCGLDCSKCEAYIATQSGKKEELEKVVQQWKANHNADVKAEDVMCDGCQGNGRKSVYCKNMCKIPPCCAQKDIENCAFCREYPCNDIKEIQKMSSLARENLEKLRK